MTAQTAPARHWQDWCSFLLGIWLCLSPWALHFESQPAATGAALALGLLIIATEIVTLSLYRPWEEWINILFGLLLLFLPTMFELEPPAAAINFFLIGFAVLGLAFYEMWNARGG